MNNLKLKLTGTQKLNPTILIDGKKAKFKKNEFGSYQCNYATENSKVNIEIVRYLELSGPLWLPIALFFFIISIFGILQPRYDKHCVALRCKFVIDVGENTEVVLKLANTDKEDSGKAIEIKTDTHYEELANEYYVDRKVKKRKVVLRIAEIFIFLVIVLVVVLGVIFAGSLFGLTGGIF